MARKVAIVGAALSDVGRVDDKSAFELHHQATSRALADSGIDRREVDGFMSHGTGALPPIELAEYLGLSLPRWVPEPSARDQWKTVEAVRSQAVSVLKNTVVSDQAEAIRLHPEERR